MENKTYCVYCHTNKINGKKYVGQTSQNPPEKRWGENGKNYKDRDKTTGEFRQSKFARAIEKYGWDNFTHEILKTGLTSQEADEIEKEYIKKYNSIKEGYNSTTGGKEYKKSDECKKQQSERMRGEKHFNYGKHLSKETREKISKGNRRKTISPETRLRISEAQTRIKRTEETKKKISEALKTSCKINRVPVICVETEQIFQSATEAEEFLGVRAHITECCKGMNHNITSGGYHWLYCSDIDKENWEKQREEILSPRLDWKCKKVICIETQIVYNSLGEASKETKIDRSSIGRCCMGKAQSAGKLHWAYYDEKEGD